MTLDWKGFLRLGEHPASVLVVDDDDELRRGLCRTIEAFGHRAKGAASAEEADQWCRADRYDLCILDVGLPRMSGVEFLEWARMTDPGMAVIMLTGLDSREVAKSCMEGGARTYLVKPIDVDFLELAVRDALAVRQLLVAYNTSRMTGEVDPP